MKYSSRIIPGRGKGTVLGFPTLNLTLPKDFKLQPGVYACLVFINQKKYLGALHFGPIPVYNQHKSSLEVHLINFISYQAPSQLNFQIIKYLRPIKDFPSPKALASQISLDIKDVKKLSH